MPQPLPAHQLDQLYLIWTDRARRAELSEPFLMPELFTRRQSPFSLVIPGSNRQFCATGLPCRKPHFPARRASCALNECGGAACSDPTDRPDWLLMTGPISLTPMTIRLTDCFGLHSPP